MNKQILCNYEQEGKRIDKVICENNEVLSRNQCNLLFKEKKVFVNEKQVKASYIIKEGDVIEYEMVEKENFEITGSKKELDIIYEDEDIIVINKPRNLVVHPSLSHPNDTLVNLLIGSNKDLSSIDEARPGIVHRIDKDTSGLLVVAKNNQSHNFLAEQLKDHTMSRKYIAVVKGVIKEKSGKIIAPIGRDPKNRKRMAVDVHNGKDATTFFYVKERLSNHTVVECELLTGRTHQIRVHMAYINHPVEGDTLYCRSAIAKYQGQLLHAYYLKLIHPRTKKVMEFEIPLPDYLTKAIEELN